MDRERHLRTLESLPGVVHFQASYLPYLASYFAYLFVSFFSSFYPFACAA
jgi:hypothetical protein